MMTGKLSPRDYLEYTLGELMCNMFPRVEFFVEDLIYREHRLSATLLMSGEDILELLDVPFIIPAQREVKKDLIELYYRLRAYNEGYTSRKTVREKCSALSHIFYLAGHMDEYDEIEDFCDLPFY